MKEVLVPGYGDYGQDFGEEATPNVQFHTNVREPLFLGKSYSAFTPFS